MEHIERMKIEFNELISKLGNAKQFYQSAHCKFYIEESQRKLLEKQIEIMKCYREVLRDRIILEEKVNCIFESKKSFKDKDYIYRI